jgi:aminoglycoside phosphotransferase (APT) family kinase protein
MMVMDLLDCRVRVEPGHMISLAGSDERSATQPDGSFGYVIEMTEQRRLIDDALVRRLIASQFPEWATLPLAPVVPGGWDNRTFRLGDRMVVRLPSAAAYAAQVDKEHRWLPTLAASLPLSIPTPLALGESAEDFPWRWSIYEWIEGNTLDGDPMADPRDIATSLAAFLNALHRIDPTGGPGAGLHNFHRGGSLESYDRETRQAIAILSDRIDARTVSDAWDNALATTWTNRPVWVHGDISSGNLLMRGGRLTAVIDFGMLAVGDPACDLAIAWTLFDDSSRARFRTGLPLDDATWARGRGWALWKALIVAAGIADTNAVDYADPWRVIRSVTTDHATS